jgi:regulator of ribonuclease activity A
MTSTTTLLLPPLTPTADLSDDNPSTCTVVRSHSLHSYGGIKHFQGSVVTCKTLEDNSMAKKIVDEPGLGRILVIDGGGSMNCALFGDMMGEKAVKNGWSGVIVNGSVRDVKQLGEMKIGVIALGTCPKRSNQRGLGERDIPLEIWGGIHIQPGNFICADEDGIVIFKSVKEVVVKKSNL